MKKVFSLLLICLPLTFLAVSCHEEEDPITTTSPYAKFRGPWTGMYMGSDSGIMDFTINGEGKIVGDVESDNFTNLDLTLKGKVNVHGEVTITLINLNDQNEEEEIGTYVGTMNKSFASGTWTNTRSNPPISGTWTAER